MTATLTRRVLVRSIFFDLRQDHGRAVRFDSEPFGELTDELPLLFGDFVVGERDRSGQSKRIFRLARSVRERLGYAAKPRFAALGSGELGKPLEHHLDGAVVE